MTITVNKTTDKQHVDTLGKHGGGLKQRLGSLGIVWVLVLLIIGAGLLNPGFLNPQNLINILSQNAAVGLIAIGMTFIMIAGGFDLSVASILAAGGVCYAALSHVLPIWLAVLLTLVLGLILGGINAFLITKVNVNAFIATLATASIFSGLTLLVTTSKPVPLAKDGYDFLADSKLVGVPVSVWVLALLAAVSWFVLAKTTYGTALYATGGNNEAARLAGLRVNTIRASTFVLTGACSTLAGAVFAGIIGVGQPGVATQVTLNSIAIVIIGGTSLFGGEGAIWRTIVGILIFGIINNFFDILAWPQATREVALGVIIIAAVSLDAYSRSRRKASNG